MSTPRGVLRLALVLTLLALAAPALAPPAGAQPAPEAALTGVTRFDAGDAHTCAVLTTGQARCWGEATFKQTGDGTMGVDLLPVTVADVDGDGPLVNLVEVTGGDSTSCARTQGGQVRCWGYNGTAQLGTGDTSVHAYAVAVEDVDGVGRLTGVRQVAAGWNHTCARVAGGQVRCWGANEDGQLGAGTNSNLMGPEAVLTPTGPGQLSGVTQIATGILFTCGRMSTGQAVCWGNGPSNQLGDGGGVDRHRPVYVKNSAGTGVLTGVRQVVAGHSFACAVLTNGQARCWGATPAGSAPLPVGVLNTAGTGPLTNIVSAAAGSSHVCFRLGTGRVLCAGENGSGQLGDRTTADRLRPVPMVNLAGTNPITGVVAVTAGEAHTCVKLSNGQLACVGSNAVGQLGDGTGVSTARPVGVRRD